MSIINMRSLFHEDRSDFLKQKEKPSLFWIEFPEISLSASSGSSFITLLYIFYQALEDQDKNWTIELLLETFHYAVSSW